MFLKLPKTFGRGVYIYYIFVNNKNYWLIVIIKMFEALKYFLKKELLIYLNFKNKQYQEKFFGIFLGDLNNGKLNLLIYLNFKNKQYQEKFFGIFLDDLNNGKLNLLIYLNFKNKQYQEIHIYYNH